MSVGKELGDGNTLVEASFWGFEEGEFSSHVLVFVLSGGSLLFSESDDGDWLTSGFGGDGTEKNHRVPVVVGVKGLKIRN
jgi:hypothetical protein